LKLYESAAGSYATAIFAGRSIGLRTICFRISRLFEGLSYIYILKKDRGVIT